MKGMPASVAAGVAIVSAAVLVACLGGIALTGPDQSFTIQQGATKTSYLRIFNEGAQTTEVGLRVTGQVVDILTISTTALQLGPGASAVVELSYRVASGHDTGLFEGSIEALSGGPLAAGVIWPVSIWVISAGPQDQNRLSLGTGLNLVSWPGSEKTFAEAFSSKPVSRVWKRSSSGSYVSAAYYPGVGWWSPDAGFTGIRCGEAYFIECSSPCEVIVDSAGTGRTLNLVKGTNLIGWVGSEMPLSVAFPQSSSNHPVYKIWRRDPYGGYKAAQYHPEQASWWSSDPSFTTLEPMKAYFVECTQDAVFNIPG